MLSFFWFDIQADTPCLCAPRHPVAFPSSPRRISALVASPSHLSSPRLPHAFRHLPAPRRLIAFVPLVTWSALCASSFSPADRDMVEMESDEIPRDAHNQDVGLLDVGDSLAPRHTDILLHARLLGILICVIHNASLTCGVNTPSTIACARMRSAERTPSSCWPSNSPIKGPRCLQGNVG